MGFIAGIEARLSIKSSAESYDKEKVQKSLYDELYSMGLAHCLSYGFDKEIEKLKSRVEHITNKLMNNHSEEIGFVYTFLHLPKLAEEFPELTFEVMSFPIELGDGIRLCYSDGKLQSYQICRSTIQVETEKTFKSFREMYVDYKEFLFWDKRAEFLKNL